MPGEGREEGDVTVLAGGEEDDVLEEVKHMLEEVKDVLDEVKVTADVDRDRQLLLERLGSVLLEEFFSPFETPQLDTEDVTVLHGVDRVVVTIVVLVSGEVSGSCAAAVVVEVRGGLPPGRGDMEVGNPVGELVDTEVTTGKPEGEVTDIEVAVGEGDG